MLRQAFNALSRVHSRAAELKRFGTPDVTTACRITPSNYFRFLEGPSSTTIHGREFVIPLDSIVDPPDPAIKKGDKIVDTVLGGMTIKEIIEIPDLGGAIMGYRVRAE